MELITVCKSLADRLWAVVAKCLTWLNSGCATRASVGSNKHVDIVQPAITADFLFEVPSSHRPLSSTRSSTRRSPEPSKIISPVDPTNQRGKHSYQNSPAKNHNEAVLAELSAPKEATYILHSLSRPSQNHEMVVSSRGSFSRPLTRWCAACQMSRAEPGFLSKRFTAKTQNDEGHRSTQDSHTSELTGIKTPGQAKIGLQELAAALRLAALRQVRHHLQLPVELGHPRRRLLVGVAHVDAGTLADQQLRGLLPPVTCASFGISLICLCSCGWETGDITCHCIRDRGMTNPPA